MPASNFIGIRERIEAYRAAHGCSLMEAKKALDRQDLLTAIEECGTFYELRQLVRVLAEKTL